MAQFSARSHNISTSELFNQRAPLQLLVNRITTSELWPSMESQSSLTEMFHTYADFLPFEYCKSVVRKIARDLEFRGDEMSDDLVELIVKYSAAGIEDDGKRGWMIYSGDPAFITGRALIRTANMHNQVGMKVWSAGLFLAELLLAVPHLIAERHVVELGAGTGCTGLIAALSSPSPLSVTMTDFHGDVLENLQHNIDMNRKCNNKMCELYCQQLDWMQCYRSEITSSEVFSSLGLAHGTAPVVLAADCCYAEDLCGILLHVVSLLLQSSSDRTESRSDDKPAVGLIATMVRNPDTYAHFEKCLATEENLCHRDITEWALAATELGGGYNGHFQPMFYYDGRDAIKLVCVAMKSEDIDNFLGTL